MKLEKLQELGRKYPHQIRKVHVDELAGNYFLTIVFKDGRREQAAIGVDKDAAREIFAELIQLQEKFLRGQRRQSK